MHVLELPELKLPVRRIVSGGQTGVDRGALDAAIALGLEHGGWCPAGRRAEDGPIPPQYDLRLTRSADYRVRTRRNVIDSDATLIFYRQVLSGGTLFTSEYAGRCGRPCRLVHFRDDCAAGQADDSDSNDPDERQIRLAALWLVKNCVEVLNVAGPRESQQPGIARAAEAFLLRLFA
jgi:hypothetical protein